MECEAAPQLPDLGLGYGVPPAQGLHGEGQEGQTLPPAVLLGTPELSIVREVEGVPWAYPGRTLEMLDYLYYS